MGVAITIRNIPEGIRDELAARAAHTGQSLQKYLALHLIELASTPTPEDAIARTRARARAVDNILTAESILAARDADRA